MKCFLSVFLFMAFFTGANGQTRYFEFRVQCGYDRWQDTSFIVAATNEMLVQEARAELEKAPEKRRFVNGRIGYGNGGYNYNGDHSFRWHFIPDQWSFAENAVEVCDGCPYSDLDADTAYWVRTIGYYCSWSARPVREVFGPTGVEEKPSHEAAFIYDGRRQKLVPEPEYKESSFRIYSLAGEELGCFSASSEIDVSGLADGFYLVRAGSGRSMRTYTLIVR